jgi:hypothetical membrane protein
LMTSVPDAKLAFLDDLVAKRDRGELADHVVKLAKEKCKRPKTELILNLAGDYGWLMTTTFFVLGLAPLIAAIGLQNVYQWSRSTRIGLGLLVVAAMFTWLAGIFRDSIPHLLAGVVAFPSMVMAVLVLSWTFRRAAGWQTIYRVALFIALGMLAMLFLMVGDLGMPGLQQRVFIFLFLLWLSIVVHKSVRLTA